MATTTAPPFASAASPAPGRQAPDAVLARRWRENRDRRAHDELFVRFLPLAWQLARRYRGQTEASEDLLQVAAIGLLAAIDRFDPAIGDLRAFAIPTILGELKRYFRSTGWGVHVPRRAQEMALRVDRATRELTAETGRAPRVGQLADYLGVSTEDVLLGLEAGAAQFSLSLDGPSPDSAGEDTASLADALGRDDPGYAVVESTAALAAAVPALPHTERRALLLRLQCDMKQSDIALALGCSQMQVSRLLRRAVERLKDELE